MTSLLDAVLCLADRIFIPDPYSAQTLLPTNEREKNILHGLICVIFIKNTSISVREQPPLYVDTLTFDSEGDKRKIVSCKQK